VQQLRDAQANLRELLVSREAHKEYKCQRIAWAMHEDLGQLLTTIKMRVSGMRPHLPAAMPALVEGLQSVISMLDESIGKVRKIVSDTRPAILSHSHVGALEWLVAEFNRHPGLECKLLADEEEDSCISGELSTLVFRVAQEILENLARHTGISSIIVSWVSRHDGHCLEIRSDGNGDAAALSCGGALGFFGMKERVAPFGGEIRVSASHEPGTLIEARFPGS
jgi:signal transduction histidine kinase